ncbi:MAG TPA: hypothetical protein VF719_02530 [Abditibacteriaceae bacterium]
MRKFIVTLMLAVVAIAGAVFAPQAQAQTYPDVKALTPFTQPANYMSLPGYLRYRHLLGSGRWISREEAEEATRQQGAPTGPATMG